MSSREENSSIQKGAEELKVDESVDKDIGDPSLAKSKLDIPAAAAAAAAQVPVITKEVVTFENFRN